MRDDLITTVVAMTAVLAIAALMVSLITSSGVSTDYEHEYESAPETTEVITPPKVPDTYVF